MQKNRIYLDNNATTKLDPRVLDAMLPWLGKNPLNPSSTHYFGQKAAHALLSARETLASYLKAEPEEVVFTSGGSEGLSWLLKGFFAKHKGAHILSSTLEHPCVLHTLQALQKQGASVSFLPGTKHGAPSISEIEKAILPTTKLLVFMSVNNITGVKTDIEELSRLAEKLGLFLIVDEVSRMGKEAFTLYSGVSGAAFSGHKFHGPLGSGFAVCKTDFLVDPLIEGGGQEYGKRGGTQNLPAIIGLAKAVELLQQELPQATIKMQSLQDLLIRRLQEKIGDITILGEGPRICNTVQIAFPHIDGETLLIQADLAGLSLSHGSACSSGQVELSPTLLHMGYPPSLVRSSLRFSLSRETTAEEIEEAVSILQRFFN